MGIESVLVAVLLVLGASGVFVLGRAIALLINKYSYWDKSEVRKAGEAVKFYTDNTCQDIIREMLVDQKYDDMADTMDSSFEHKGDK